MVAQITQQEWTWCSGALIGKRSRFLDAHRAGSAARIEIQNFGLIKVLAAQTRVPISTLRP